MQEPSIFTRIRTGDIPQEIIYKDEHCFVILTHEPLTPGHCLIIPVQEVPHLWDASDELYNHLLSVAKQMAQTLRKVYDYPRVGMIVEGFGVPQHAHIHVMGLHEGLEPTMIAFSATRAIATPAELKAEADKLRV